MPHGWNPETVYAIRPLRYLNYRNRMLRTDTTLGLLAETSAGHEKL